MMDNIESDCGDFHLKTRVLPDFWNFKPIQSPVPKFPRIYTGARRRVARLPDVTRCYQWLLSHYNENTTPRAHSEKKQFLAPGLSFVNTVMDTDEILEEIGSFGYFQKRNTLLLGLIIFVLTFQTASMVFIGGEPTWRCTPNSTVCTRNGTFSADDNFYKERCNMSSEDWEFTTEFTSIVTEGGEFI